MQNVSTTIAEDPAIATDPVIISGRISNLDDSVRAMVGWRAQGGVVTKKLVRDACGDWVEELIGLRRRRHTLTHAASAV